MTKLKEIRLLHMATGSRTPTAAVQINDSRVTAPSSSARIGSIDIVRGAVMVLMAIDHVRVYSGLPAGGPTAGIFLTRWITHFVAPSFIFLAGTAAFLHAGDCSFWSGCGPGTQHPGPLFAGIRSSSREQPLELAVAGAVLRWPHPDWRTWADFVRSVFHCSLGGRHGAGLRFWARDDH